MEKYTNDLIHETSPYLLQHAHNPVNWVAWSESAFERAQLENKLLLVSVGYSACHWCHVMEHESFEDEEVAALMNKFFVCIKVDREERPDVDQVYMTAVQLMTQRGGWPLNCFTTPDGRPIYGGTYFPKEQWMHVLKSLEFTFRNDPQKVEQYAQQLQEGVKNSELIAQAAMPVKFEISKLEELILRWSKSFDIYEGGDSKAPKFMLPNNYQFLLKYGHYYQKETVLKHVELTLDKMAYGGVYDQIGGAFARYSVDMLWKVPHFEKMLYDNGQLLSLYAEGYRKFKKPLYKRIVYQIVSWLEREMLSSYGSFYSALDADSEGVEGKFYTWTVEELKAVLGAEFDFAKDVYNVNQLGYWEDEQYILMRAQSDAIISKKYQLSQDQLEVRLDKINQLLLDERSHRIRPGLDDKSLTAWNAMVIKGLCDAYHAFGEEEFLHLATKNVRWLEKYQVNADGTLNRNFKNGKATIPGFLEDYAHVIDAFITYGTAIADASYLIKAKEWTEFVRLNFQEKESDMFYFTANSTELFARKMELNDNVIPATNSVMARNLFHLSRVFQNKQYRKEAEQMLTNIYDGMEMYGSGYSNWGMLLIDFLLPEQELCIVGKNAGKKLLELKQANYFSSTLCVASTDTDLPLIKDKPGSEDALIYICVNQACQLPVNKVEEVKIE